MKKLFAGVVAGPIAETYFFGKGIGKGVV